MTPFTLVNTYEKEIFPPNLQNTQKETDENLSFIIFN